MNGAELGLPCRRDMSGSFVRPTRGFLVRRLVLVLVSAATALAFGAPARATVHSCSGTVDVACWNGDGKECLVWANVPEAWVC
jgi:hypothetical protein